MSDRIPPPPQTAAPSVASVTSAANAPSFAEAQRRLAARRRERAAADAERRAQAAAAAVAQREASAAALRARLDAGGPLASSSSPLVRRLGGTALVAWDGVGRAASTISNTLSGNATTTTTTLDAAGHRPAFRVSQVDAELLDEELLELLRGQVGDALQYVRGGTLQDDWQPEIMLLLRAALFKLSVWDHDATYGAALQNLRYADARAVGGKRGAMSAAVPIPPSNWQKAVYGLVTVGGRYAWTKWEDWLRDYDEYTDGDGYGEEGGGSGGGGDQNSGSNSGISLSFLSDRLRLPLTPEVVRRLARVTSVASDLYAGAAFVSFLVFLRYGRYRTILDRVLRMRLVPPTSQVSHEVSFEYLNRQLVWHAFTEFLLFLLPLVGINRWRRWLTRTWRKTKTAVVKATAAVKGASGDGREDEGVTTEKTGEYAFLPERTCAICYQDQNTATSEADIMAAAAASSGVIGSAETDITNPYEAVPCGCVYCYVSLATRIEREEGDGWTCLRCGTLVTSCRPWNGDVLEPASLLPAAAKVAGGIAGASVVDGRPSSSSTNASGTPSYTQKTVGFADDVKGEDDDEETSHDEILIADAEGEEEDEEDDDAESADDAEFSASDAESEAYEDGEDSVEGEIDGDLEDE